MTTKNKQTKMDQYNESIYRNSGIIAISNNITLLQRKLFNFLVWHAYIDLADKETYEISINSLKNRLWFNSSNNKYLQDSLRTLIVTAVDFNLLWKDKGDWSASALLAWVSFKSWICYYSFSPILREKLHTPNVYAKLNLNLIKLFSSKYSLCLYEIAIDYMKINCTPFIPLDIFRKLMWVEQNKYSEFKRLKQRVIDPSIKELNTIAWFTIKIEYQKKWRKISAIKFLLHEVKLDPTINSVNPQSQDKLLAKIQQNHLLQKSLIDDYGLTLRNANKIIKTYPIPYIKESLEIIRLKIITWAIKNIPAYTLTVLKNDYVKTIQPKQDKKSESEIPEQITTTMSSSDTPTTSKKAKEYFAKLSEIEQNNLIKKFENEKIIGWFFEVKYKKIWLDGAMFRVMFDSWLSGEI